MWNDPLRKKYLAKGIFPLHDIVMASFDTVEEKHHQRVMDSLYNSDAFYKAAYNHEKNYWIMVLQGKELEVTCHTLN